LAVEGLASYRRCIDRLERGWPPFLNRHRVTGQIITRGEQRKWLVRIFLGRDANGKQKFHNHMVHGNKKDAEAYRNKILPTCAIHLGNGVK